jgi:hypothetical protein
MRTHRDIFLTTLLAACAGSAFGGPTVYSNFADFVSNQGFIAQASAVTASNDAIVVPFQSNTASMQVMLDNAQSVRTVRVLAPTLFVQNASPGIPGVVFNTDPSSALDPRDAPASASDAGSLAPLRVSIYSSASDVESRNAFVSVDFGAGDYTHAVWGLNSAFYEIGFDLGATFDLDAGDWFIEVAQIDPDPTQFFLALGAGSGMHRFDVNTGALTGSDFDFALEIGAGVIIPLPTGGAMGLIGMTVLAIARRRRA